MYEILSTILKYFFTVIIYAFIYSIIRLIYLDIHSMSVKLGGNKGEYPYLKLLNRREDIPFKVDEIYSLKGNKTFGRSNGNDYIIKDPFLSSEHAEFSFRDGKVYLKDKGSTNGTYINSIRIGREEQLIKNGDRVTVGNLTFILVEPTNSNINTHTNTNNYTNTPSSDGSEF